MPVVVSLSAQKINIAILNTRQTRRPTSALCCIGACTRRYCCRIHSMQKRTVFWCYNVNHVVVCIRCPNFAFNIFQLGLRKQYHYAVYQNSRNKRTNLMWDIVPFDNRIILSFEKVSGCKKYNRSDSSLAMNKSPLLVKPAITLVKKSIVWYSHTSIWRFRTYITLFYRQRFSFVLFQKQYRSIFH